MTTTTAAAGAPAGATDGKADSSTATTAPAAERSSSQRMADTLRERRKADEGKRSPTAAINQADATKPGAEGVNEAGKDVPPEDGAAVDAAEKGKADEADSVPMKAFKGRIGEITKKLRTAEGERDAKDRDLQRTKAALQLSLEELEAFKEAVRSTGKLPDERDEQLRQHSLSERSRAEADRIEKDIAAARAKREEQGKLDERRGRIERDVEDACAKHTLVKPNALKLELREVWKTNPRATPAAVAAKLEQDLLDLAKARLVPSVPAAPTTTQASANGSAVRFEDNAKGMAARLRAKRAAGV